MEQVLANVGYFLELWMIQIYLSLTWDTKLCFGRFSCFLFVWNGVVATAVNAGILPKACIWMTYGWLIAYFRRKFHKGFKECVARFGIALSCVLATEFAAGLIGLLLQEYIVRDVIMLVVINLISVCIAELMWILVKKYKSVKQPDVNYKKLFGITLVCTTIFIILVINYSNNQKLYITYDLIIATVIVVMYWYFNKVQKMEYELKQQKLEMDVTRTYNKVYDESIKDIRRKQHEFQNQLTAIYGTHRIAATLEELVDIQKEYCKELQKDSRYDGILLKCNESVVAGFLYCKCVECEEQGVSVDYDIVADKLECKVLVHELIEILGILIDNAFEKELENNHHDRNIELWLHEDDTRIGLSVGNMSEYVMGKDIEQMFCNGYSTKGSGRGLGLARVKQLTNKYGLEIRVMNEKRETNWIVFSIIIDKEIRTTNEGSELSAKSD